MSRDNSTVQPTAPLAWAGVLAGAVLVGTLATSCLMPFVALSVMAAATLSRGRAAMTVAAAWLANQALGITIQHVPMTPYSLGWGAAAGVAALAVVVMAGFVVGGRRLSIGRTVVAFILGFALYEGLLFVYSGAVGGRDTFTPAVVWLIGRNEVIWLAGLATTHLLLAWRAPRWFAPRAAGVAA